MRIIAGKFKGKKILEPQDQITRPLKDLAKESIFNVVKHSNKFNANIEDANILDLFSGVGSFGLEAISRGAKFVTFVENYQSVLNVLKKNIQNLNLNEKSKIIEKDIFQSNFFKELSNNFDLIFIDPPFKEKKISLILSEIKNSNILKKDGLIIIHRNSEEKEVYFKEFKILEEKKYGISKVIFGIILN